MSKSIVTRPNAPGHLEPELLQRIVDRRIALKLGLSLPLAAAVASLAGLGPRDGRAGR